MRESDNYRFRDTWASDNNIYFSSFGVFIPKLKDYFGAGSAEVSTIYSIQVGVTFGSGR